MIRRVGTREIVEGRGEVRADYCVQGGREGANSEEGFGGVFDVSRRSVLSCCFLS